MPSSAHVLIMISLIFLSIFSANVNEAKGVAVPMQMMMMNKSSRRKLRGLQKCAACTCCDKDKRVCVSTQCCYALSCNIPGKPPGSCFFAPKSCNCNGCN